MAYEELSDFFSLPWAQTLIQDPSWQAVKSFSRIPPAAPSTENSLLASTLHSPDCVRAVASFHYFTAISGGVQTYVGHQTRMLFSLGPGLNGHSGFAAGGFIGSLIDEVTGQCVATVFGRGIITAEMTVKYLNMLSTPRVVLCRAWIEEEPVRRKVWVKASIEDGLGSVFATGNALFIRGKPKL